MAFKIPELAWVPSGVLWVLGNSEWLWTRFGEVTVCVSEMVQIKTSA